MIANYTQLSTNFTQKYPSTAIFYGILLKICTDTGSNTINIANFKGEFAAHEWNIKKRHISRLRDEKIITVMERDEKIITVMEIPSVHQQNTTIARKNTLNNSSPDEKSSRDGKSSALVMKNHHVTNHNEQKNTFKLLRDEIPSATVMKMRDGDEKSHQLMKIHQQNQKPLKTGEIVSEELADKLKHLIKFNQKRHIEELKKLQENIDETIRNIKIKDNELLAGIYNNLQPTQKKEEEPEAEYIDKGSLYQLKVESKNIEHCDKHNIDYDMVTGIMDKYQMRRETRGECPECRKERKLKYAGVPFDFIVRMHNLDINNKFFKKVLKGMQDNQTQHYIIGGKTKLGKTTTACMVAAEFVAKNKTIYYTSLHKLMQQKEPEEYKKDVENINDADLVIIDEINNGFFGSREFLKDRFKDILDILLQKNAIFITNIADREKLCSEMHAEVYNRMLPNVTDRYILADCTNPNPIASDHTAHELAQL